MFLKDVSCRYCQRLVINYFIVTGNRLKIGAGYVTFILKILNPLEGISHRLYYSYGV
jgi:hypothetical protein